MILRRRLGRAGWGRGTRVGATFYTNLNSFVQLTPNTDESDPCFNDVFYLVSTLEESLALIILESF